MNPSESIKLKKEVIDDLQAAFSNASEIFHSTCTVKNIYILPGDDIALIETDSGYFRLILGTIGAASAKALIKDT